MTVIVEVVCSAAAGIGLTKGMEWGGKKIGEVAKSLEVERVARLVIGVSTPFIVNGAAEYLGLDFNIRVLISAGVVAESILSGARLGNDLSKSEEHGISGEMVGKAAAISVTCLSNVNLGAQVGFLAPILTIGYLHARQIESAQDL